MSLHNARFHIVPILRGPNDRGILHPISLSRDAPRDPRLHSASPTFASLNHSVFWESNREKEVFIEDWQLFEWKCCHFELISLLQKEIFVCCIFCCALNPDFESRPSEILNRSAQQSSNQFNDFISDKRRTKRALIICGGRLQRLRTGRLNAFSCWADGFGWLSNFYPKNVWRALKICNSAGERKKQTVSRLGSYRKSSHYLDVCTFFVASCNSVWR
jgi:hypothetical protein